MIAIDLGSNSCRAISFDCKTKQITGEYEAIVKTADQLHQTQKISAAAIERVLKALHEADQKLSFKDHNICAVTTQAMRKATNSEMVLQRFMREAGVEFKIIDADKEAYYTLIAVESRLKALKHASEHFVLIDVGGGSTEIIFYKDGKFESQSFEVGIVTTAQHVDDGVEIHSYLEDLFEPLRSYVHDYYAQNAKPESFVATAGTPTTMAAFLMGMNYNNYDVSQINGYELSLAATQKALEGLMALDELSRAAIVGVGRESLIAAGIIIVQKLYDVLGFEVAVVIDDGVREGVALDYCLQQ